MIESPYLCIQPGNGPNELFMGTLVKRKCVGGESAATHCRPSMSGDGPKIYNYTFSYQHFPFTGIIPITIIVSASFQFDTSDQKNDHDHDLKRAMNMRRLVCDYRHSVIWINDVVT